MRKTLHKIVSAILCLTMLASSFSMPVYADANVTAEEHVHEHVTALPESLNASVIDLTPQNDAPAVNPSRVALSENGITITAYLPSGHFHTGTFMCEPPMLKIEAKDDIDSITFGTKSAYNEEEKTLQVDDCVISGNTATVNFDPGLRNYILVHVTAGTNKADLSLMISHGIGKIDRFDYAATCTRPARHEQVYHCDICPAISHTATYIDKNDKPNGHDFEDKTVDVTECEGESKQVVIQVCKTCSFTQYKDESNKFDESLHDFSVVVNVKALCDQDGTSNLKCSKCDAVKISVQSVTKSLSHDLPSWGSAERIPATCTGYGKIVRICKNCGVDESSYIYPLGHNWKVDSVDVAPTCYAPGEATVKCTRCGETEAHHELKIVPHNYEYTVVVPSTCTTNGYAANICSYCKQEAPNSRVELPKSGHVKAADDGDCTTPILCTNCQAVVVEAKEHSFGTRYYTDGTCHWNRCQNYGCLKTSEPEKHSSKDKHVCTENFQCQVCDRWIAKMPHTFPQEFSRSDNLYHYIECEVCGTVQGYLHSYVDDRDCSTPVECTACGRVKTPAKEHVYSEWVSDGDTGYHVHDCINNECDHEERAPHNFNNEPVVENYVAPTCTTPGSYDNVYTCPDCSEHKVEHVTVEALGHSFNDWFTDVESDNCESGHVEKRVCSVCGLTETKNVDGKAHDWEDHYTVDKAPTCTADGSESIHCKNCDVTKDPKAIAQIPHDYDKSTPIQSVEPSCTVNGGKTYKCKNCDSETYEVVPATGHTFGEYVYNEDATCRVAGTMTHTCDICQHKETVDDPDHGVQPHSYTVWTYQNNATIYSDGTEISYCDYKCGTYSTRTVPGTKLHEHTFINYKIIKEETCTDDRVVEAICEVCGEEKDTRTVSGTALGHSEGNPIILTEATCVDNAIAKTVCVRCGVTIKESYEIENSALGHSWSEYVYDNNATTEEDGTETATCTVCGAKDVRKKAGTKLEGEHVFIHYVYNNDATCTNGTETAYCENGCGSTDTREAVGTALGHDYVETKVISDATCTANEVKEAECSRCGDVIRVEIPESALGHDLTNLVIVTPATCTEDAEGEFHCTRCDYVTETKVIEGSRTGHKYGEWISETPSTCVDEGRMYRECSVCHVREYDSDPADGHLWDDDFTVDIPATCEHDGSKSIHCSRCGATTEETVIPRREHDFKVTETVDPTCTDDGLETRTCSYPDCQYEEHNTIPALGHEYSVIGIYDGENPCVDDDYTVTKCSRCGDEYKTVLPGTALGHEYIETLVPATCTEDGYTVRTCERCNDEQKEVREGTALGHSYGDFKVTKEPTASEAGEKTADCTRCGETVKEVIPAYTSIVTGEGVPEVKVDSDQLAKAVGVTESEQKLLTSGEMSLVLDITDASKKVTEDEVSMVLGAASRSSLTVAAYYDIDLFKVTRKDGNVTEENITSTASPIRITVEIPESMRAENRKFFLIRLHDGAADVLSDLDSAPDTITVETSLFSIYSIAYSDDKPLEHHHAFVYMHDDGGHWLLCVTCGTRMIYQPHTLINGVCPACGYAAPNAVPPTSDDDGSIKVDVPTEGKVAVFE